MNTPNSNTSSEVEDLKLAEKFHYTYERLAPKFGYETREDTREFDPQSKNGKLMIAVCHEINRDFTQSEIKGRIDELENLKSKIIDSNHLPAEQYQTDIDKYLTITSTGCFECLIQDRLSELNQMKVK